MAFIQPTLMPMSFQGGFQSKTDALQVLPPALLDLQNGMFTKVGALSKRFGFDALPTAIQNGGTISAAYAIDSFNSELNLFDNNNLYTYIEANQTWSNRGIAISVINTNNQITRNISAQQLNPDCNFVNNLEVYAYEDSRVGGSRYSIVDHDTKSYVVADKTLGGVKPKTIVFNNTIYLFYTDGICNLFVAEVNPNNPSILEPPVSLFADGYYSSQVNFTYDVLAADGYLYVAYIQTGVGGGFIPPGLPTVVVKQYNTSMTLVNSVIVDLAIGPINLCIDSLNQLWVSYGANTIPYVKVSTLNATTLTTILAATVVDTIGIATLTGIESNTAGVLQLTYEVGATDGNPSDQYIKTCFIQNSGVVTPLGQLLSVGLASKAFRQGNNIFANIAHQSTLQSTYFTVLLGVKPFTIVGKVAPDVGGGLRTNNLLPEIPQISPGVFLHANLIKGAYTSEDNISFSLLGVNSTLIDFTDINKFNSVTQSNNLLFVGGIIQSYDGFSANEQNFHIFPENITYEVIPFGGSLSVGQYQYQFLYAWSDKFGQVQYSAPSAPITVTITAVNSQVVFAIDTLRLTAKTNVIIQGYRTQVNQTVLQEVTSTVAPLKNDPTVNYVEFIDSVADSEISSNATIYTTGGVLPNSAPPSASLISLYQGRVMLAGISEDKNLIWFSKNKFNSTNYNTIPVEFSADNTIGVDPRGGASGITALGLMDANLIIFKESAIFLLTGDGPSDTGTGDTFPDPELISSNVGCINQNSILLTKDGLFFQSSKGLYLLDRSLGLTYVGAPVESFNSLAISSAVLDPNDNILEFPTTTGNTIIYDYYIQQWTSWSGAPTAAADAIVYNGLYTFVKPNGTVFVQNRNSFQDNYGSGVLEPIIMELTTPWISAAGIQGYQRTFRAYLLGTYKGPHQLKVNIGYNFDNAFLPGNLATINASALAGGNQWGSDSYWGESSPWGSSWQVYEFQINFQQQTCTSFRLYIADSPTSPYTEGYSLSSLNLEVGILPSGNRLPATNKTSTGQNS
jgi:hypothetical protein